MSRKWSRKPWAAAIRERAGNRCEKCGYAGPKRLHAHHINGDGSDHRLENGICLCASCHLTLHYAGMNVHHLWTKTSEERSTIARKAAETRARNLSPTCRRGHGFTPENTGYTKDGKRRCRACERLRSNARYHRTKGEIYADFVEIAPLREAFLASGLTAYEVARRLGWQRNNSSYFDSTRVLRAFGLKPRLQRSGAATLGQRVRRDRASELLAALEAR